MIDRRGYVWLPEEYSQLKQEFATGKSLGDIAKDHGRSPYAIIAKLVAMRLIVEINGDYYRIESDPWVLGSVVRYLQDQ